MRPAVRYQVVPVPVGIDRTSAKAAVASVQARTLEHLDLWSVPGQAIRGRGCAPSRDVAVSAGSVISAGIFRRRDCRQVLVDASTAGVWRAHFGGPNSRGGGLCAGPLPDWPDLPTGAVYVKATTEAPGDVIWAGAKAGKRYEVRAKGLWARDPDWASFGGDQDGEWSGATFSSAPFANNSLRGLFHVVEPGNAQPIPAGAYVIVVCTADGDLKGCFADNQGAYGDNVGQVAVTVREL